MNNVGVVLTAEGMCALGGDFQLDLFEGYCIKISVQAHSSGSTELLYTECRFSIPLGVSLRLYRILARKWTEGHGLRVEGNTYVVVTTLDELTRYLIVHGYKVR